MEPQAIITFAAVLAVACASPGPTIAALVARVLGRGAVGAPAFCLGLLISDIAWLSGAVLGLALLAETIQPIFLVIRYLGAAYLLYLAWKLWSAPAVALAAAPALPGEGIRLFLGGLAVGSGNPKTALFYLALLPSLLPLEAVKVADYLILVATQGVVYGGILVGYVILAARARQAFANSRAMSYVNRLTGVVMAGAAAAIATRS